jgi:hypothetical protein
VEAVVKYRRAGQQESAPTPLRAHRAVEISPRVQRDPGRGGAIRGLAEIVEARRQTPEAWAEVWAEELRSKGEAP